jgi:integrase/recombinase XerD
MKSAKINFEIRTDRTSKGKHPIVIRLYANKKNKYITSLFKVSAKDWLIDKERTKNDLQINSYLNDLNSKFNQILIENPTNTNLEQIADKLFNIGDQNKSRLLYYISNYIEDKEKKNDVIRKTITRYKRVEKVLIDFLAETKNKHVRLTDINTELINQFDTYIKHNLKVNDKQMGKNTINKYHSIFRTILIQALNEGKISTNPYNNFKLKSKPTNRHYLSNDELNLFRNTQFDLERNEKVRLIYLFSCYTGIRFEDSQRLTIKNMKKTAKGETYLSFISSKSEKQQEIPLLNDAVAIIQEIKEKFKSELDETGAILPKISNQKFNDYLKAISVRIGIDKELTHHTARHTFATYMLSNGVAPSALQVLLGHSNIRETMIYAKITPDYLIDEVKKGNARI